MLDETPRITNRELSYYNISSSTSAMQDNKDYSIKNTALEMINETIKEFWLMKDLNWERLIKRALGLPTGSISSINAT